jgi:hypothetical protein
MSGTPATPPGGAAPGVASDQSMEDILASIRRILNEDEAPAAPAPAAAAAAEEPLLLTEEMIVAAPAEAAAPEPPAPEPPAPAVAAVAPAPAEPPAAPPPAVPAGDALLAPAAAAAATAAVGQLLRAVSSERGAAVTRGGPSIEDVVREELRPLLKAWLDQHLPGVVERLVRAEIERVVGRALS